MKRAFAILYIICIFPLCGCSGGIYSNYKEVEQLQLVRTMGLDREEDQVRLTVSSGKTGESGPSALLSIAAPSVATAARKLNDFAGSKQLFYDHTEFILLGEETLRQDVSAFLGSVERSTEMRTSIELFAVRGDSAQSLMTGSGDASYDISEVMDAVQRDMRLRGDAHAFTVAETQRALSERGAALICALRSADTKDIVKSVEAGITAVPDGFGILTNGQLADFLDAEEALAACLMMETGGLSTLTLTDGSSGTATVVIERSSCQVTPYWSETGLDSVGLTLKVSAALAELSDGRQLHDGSYLDELGKLLAKELETRCGKVLETSRALSADFLGLGRRLRAKDAIRFDALDSPWPGQTTFTVSVTAAVDRAGGLDDSVSSKGGGTLNVPEQ